MNENKTVEYINSLVLVICAGCCVSSFLADKIRDIALSRYTGNKKDFYIDQAKSLILEITEAVEKGTTNRNCMRDIDALFSLLGAV